VGISLLGFQRAAVVSASSVLDIYNVYAKPHTIDGCKYSSKDLQDARQQLAGDQVQYAPDFADALDLAAQKRASGACEKHTGATTAAVATATTAPVTTGAAVPTSASPPAIATQAPAPAAADVAPAATPGALPAVTDTALIATTSESGNSSTPAPLLLLAVLGAFALVLASIAGMIRWWAWEPLWIARSRHAVAEAGWRASAVWAEFVDWVRFGRR
jgi:hypothetical protein